jgi:uracil-DNA glycosylase
MPNAVVPDFDPWDGGIEAEVLYLLEAPGPKATVSGFISRNNPDETAKNFFELNAAAEIPRKRTITWNAVPWFIGTGKKLRAARVSDLREGETSLLELLGMLPRLRAIVLVGRKAGRMRSVMAQSRPDLKVFQTPHPSPMYCNRAKGNKRKILDGLREVAAFLGKPSNNRLQRTAEG